LQISFLSSPSGKDKHPVSFAATPLSEGNETATTPILGGGNNFPLLLLFRLFYIA